MNTSTVVRLLALLLVVAASSLVFGQKANPQTELSCRLFVQAFYDWYTPKAAVSDSLDLALKEKAQAFSPKLLQRLREDSEAQAKADEIVGLDYDPFLASQDPCERYIAERVTFKAARCFVEVHSVCEGKKRVKAEIVPELMRSNGQWIFVNFHYGKRDDGGLLKNLEKLREDHKRDPSGAQ